MKNKLKGLYTAKCSYMRKHDICDWSDEEREKFKCMDEDGWCLSIILDTNPFS